MGYLAQVTLETLIVLLMQRYLGPLIWGYIQNRPDILRLVADQGVTRHFLVQLIEELDIARIFGVRGDRANRWNEAWEQGINALVTFVEFRMQEAGYILTTPVGHVAPHHPSGAATIAAVTPTAPTPSTDVLERLRLNLDPAAKMAFAAERARAIKNWVLDAVGYVLFGVLALVVIGVLVTRVTGAVQNYCLGSNPWGYELTVRSLAQAALSHFLFFAAVMIVALREALVRAFGAPLNRWRNTTLCFVIALLYVSETTRLWAMCEAHLGMRHENVAAQYLDLSENLLWVSVVAIAISYAIPAALLGLLLFAIDIPADALKQLWGAVTSKGDGNVPIEKLAGGVFLALASMVFGGLMLIAVTVWGNLTAFTWVWFHKDRILLAATCLGLAALIVTIGNWLLPNSKLRYVIWVVMGVVAAFIFFGPVWDWLVEMWRAWHPLQAEHHPYAGGDVLAEPSSSWWGGFVSFLRDYNLVVAAVLIGAVALWLVGRLHGVYAAVAKPLRTIAVVVVSICACVFVYHVLVWLHVLRPM